MKVVICGGGHVGFSIAQYLSEEYDVALVDNFGQTLHEVSEHVDIQTVHGNPSDPEVLKSAGLSQSSILIAVTDSDESNIVACQIAHSLFKTQLKIAQIRHSHYFKPEMAQFLNPEHFPVDVLISPEAEVAKSIHRHLQIPHAFEVMAFADGSLQVLGVKIFPNSPVLYMPIERLEALFPHLSMRIFRIFRDRTMLSVSPRDEITLGDEIFILTKTVQAQEVMTSLGYAEEIARRLLIVGGGKIGLKLAEEIEQSSPHLFCSVIELQKERARFLVSQLNKTLVLQGDGLDTTLLQEAGLENVDTVVAVTNDDKTNILASLLAKRYGAKRTIALVNRRGYVHLVHSLGVDKILIPSTITIATILQRVRRHYINAIYPLGDSQGEIVETEVAATCYASGMNVHELNQHKDLEILAVVRQNTVIFASLELTLHPYDRIILVVGPDGFKKFKKFFEPRDLGTE
ncbi:MAG: Trk system potassium transporter TrkA [Alphaproteobacteria bacterium]